MDFTICMKALGDPTRLTIFNQLLIRRHCTRSLSRKLGISEAAVSQHLKVLREAELVCREKYGYHTHYFPAQAALDFLADTFEQMRQASKHLSKASGICQCEFREETGRLPTVAVIAKENDVMRIAVTYENGDIFQHFGHTEQFKLYDVRDNVVQSTQVVSAEGFGHGALAGFLAQQKVDALICGGIGGGAQAALSAQNIRLYAGCEGDADTAVNALLAGTLAFDASPECTHHGEHAHGDCHHEGDDCSHHGEKCCH